ncbi:MAG: hypothetical protein WBF17_24710 [Phycisphaerae bacterium]
MNLNSTMSYYYCYLIGKNYYCYSTVKMTNLNWIYLRTNLNLTAMKNYCYC